MRGGLAEGVPTPIESCNRSTGSQSLNETATADRINAMAFRFAVFVHDISPDYFLLKMNRTYVLRG
jgi:hypothetical protein